MWPSVSAASNSGQTQARQPARTWVGVEARDNRDGLALVPRHARDEHLAAVAALALLLGRLGPAAALLFLLLAICESWGGEVEEL